MPTKRAAQGAGTIRKKIITRNGKQYTYWEARVTVGRDPGTGKQIQRSFSGKTQKEVREKMQAAAVAVNTGTFIAPSAMSIGQWFDIWLKEYTGNLKPLTLISYTLCVNNHIKPFMGAVKLSALQPHTVQAFVNNLDGHTPATVRNLYRILHIGLERAVKLGYIAKNPATDVTLPKKVDVQIVPLDDKQIAALLAAAKGSFIENVIYVALFTGMRISEIVGMTWDQIDEKHALITINKQLTRIDERGQNNTVFATPKSGKTRVIQVANSVMNVLRNQKKVQRELKLRAGKLWKNDNDLVFTSEDGSFLLQARVYQNFKKLCASAGIENARFHDLRHTYAVNAIRAGDDIKTVQGNLGHASAAFTLDRYGHFTEQMKQDSATRMEAYIKSIQNL